MHFLSPSEISTAQSGPVLGRRHTYEPMDFLFLPRSHPRPLPRVTLALTREVSSAPSSSLAPPRVGFSRSLVVPRPPEGVFFPLPRPPSMKQATCRRSSLFKKSRADFRCSCPPPLVLHWPVRAKFWIFAHQPAQYQVSFKSKSCHHYLEIRSKKFRAMCGCWFGGGGGGGCERHKTTTVVVAVGIGGN